MRRRGWWRAGGQRAVLLAAIVLSGCGGSLGPDPRTDAAGGARDAGRTIDAAKVDAGGSADAPVDARVPVDTGIDAGAGVDAARPNQVTCVCSGGTQISLCSASTCAPAALQAICGAQCAGFGGLATSSCVMRTRGCAPTASSLAISCACGDGATVGRCTTTECSGGAATAAACDELCAAHGGSTGGSCQTDPTCVGPNLVECFCGSETATPIDVCAGIDCSSGLAMDSVCKPVCAALGGLWGTGCFAASAATATCE